MAKQKEETEMEKRVRETNEANAKLVQESDQHLAQHNANQEKAKKEKEALERAGQSGENTPNS